MKKKFIILFSSLLVVFGVVFILRFVIGGNEDTWICENDTWVAHGVPSSTPPEKGCGSEKRIGGDKDQNGCLIAAGYSWCEEKNKCLREWEEPCTQEKAFEALSNLKKETKIDFSGIGKTSFEWTFEKSLSPKNQPIIKELEGKIISVESLGNSKVTEVKNYFENQGFIVNSENVATETYKSLIGYENQNMVCLVTITVSGYVPDDPNKTLEPSDTKTVKVVCSELEE